jgi:hypothetical protein
MSMGCFEDGGVWGELLTYHRDPVLQVLVVETLKLPQPRLPFLDMRVLTEERRHSDVIATKGMYA